MNIILLLITITLYSQAVYSEVVTDGSVGEVKSLSGNMLISQELGKLSGNNLFHSFKTFNINTGESASFTTNSPSLKNVISRVTGGSVSTINGALSLKATGSQPDFFFINPAGVIFGSNSRIDVPAAFHVSTADNLSFSDGNTFSADINETGSFSMAQPQAFGFLGNQSSTIEVAENGNLSNTDKSVNLIAGDIELNGQLMNSQGDIRVLAYGQQAGDVTITGDLPSGMGNLSMKNATLQTSTQDSNTAGSIQVSANNITLESSYIRSGTNSDAQSGDVSVTAQGKLSLSNNAVISSNALGGARAGDVTVKAANLSMDNTGNTSLTGIVSDTLQGSGSGGKVTVQIDNNIDILNGARISSNSSSQGNGGKVFVNAKTIFIEDQGNNGTTGIISDTSNGTGQAGSVDVVVLEKLTVSKGGRISSNSTNGGDANEVNVKAGEIVLDRQNTNSVTGILSDTVGGTGKGGKVIVTVDGLLKIINGAVISSDSISDGDAGKVRVTAGEVILDRNGSNSPTGITSDAKANSTGNAGIVEVEVKESLQVLNGAVISSDTLSSGNAASVNVQAKNIILNGQNSGEATGVLSDNRDGSTGNGGIISVTAEQTLKILNGARISTVTRGPGVAGEITVEANDLLVDNQSSNQVTGIFSGALADSSGQNGDLTIKVNNELDVVNGGSIAIENAANVDSPGSIIYKELSIDAKKITLSNNSRISASSTENIHGSNVLINFTESLYSDSSKISSSTNLGNAGKIKINGQGTLTLENSQITTSVQDFFGSGGNITISADALVLKTGFIQANTAAKGANGGEVKINIPLMAATGNNLSVGAENRLFFKENVFADNVIQAAAPGGESGDITIRAPRLDLSGNLVIVKPPTFEAASLGRNPCQNTQGSSLAFVKRTSLPDSYSNLLNLSDNNSKTNRPAQQLLTGGCQHD